MTDAQASENTHYPVYCRTEFEQRVVRLFVDLLRRGKSGAMIIALIENNLARFWANGQPAGVVKQ